MADGREFVEQCSVLPSDFGGNVRSPETRHTNHRIAHILGYVGGVWGILVTFFFLNALLPHGRQSQTGPQPLSGLPFLLVSLALFGAAIAFTATNRRKLLTAIVVLLVALNVLALASVGLLLLPGTVCLAAAAASFWEHA